ncbi:hypothetical protein PV327_001562 [Microctonus hyperodae]|uniref:Uncharacterized protein n=1 Tax=Microctonus hyperodae TaxID=165561 RepID=A0AA39G8G7_MICHY|nr:hypothetical protein PV327_001562 [Microctonus hyperodae]
MLMKQSEALTKALENSPRFYNMEKSSMLGEETSTNTLEKVTTPCPSPKALSTSSDGSVSEDETSTLEKGNLQIISNATSCTDLNLTEINFETPVVEIGENIIYDHNSYTLLQNSIEEFKNDTRIALNKITNNLNIIMQYITSDKGVDFLDKLNPVNGLKSKDLNILITSIEEFKNYMDIITADSAVRKNTESSKAAEE